METQKEAIARLCKEVTTSYGQPLKIRKDFAMLANSIFEKTRQNVSASTLMRIFGYTKSSSLPNISTLDLLAVYAGYSDFVSFVGSRYLADVTLPSSEPKDEIPESVEIQDPDLSKSDSVNSPPFLIPRNTGPGCIVAIPFSPSLSCLSLLLLPGIIILLIKA